MPLAPLRLAAATAAFAVAAALLAAAPLLTWHQYAPIPAQQEERVGGGNVLGYLNLYSTSGDGTLSGWHCASAGVGAVLALVGFALALAGVGAAAARARRAD